MKVTISITIKEDFKESNSLIIPMLFVLKIYQKMPEKLFGNLSFKRFDHSNLFGEARITAY